MKVVLQSEIIDKLTPRGILAYVAVAMCGYEGSTKQLAEAVHVNESLILDGMKSLSGLQNLDPKPKKKKVQPSSGFALPEWINREAWDGFEESRKRMRTPMTDRARMLTVKDLIQLEKEGHKHEDVLNQSAKLGWRGVFAVRDNGSQPMATKKIVETEFVR